MAELTLAYLNSLGATTEVVRELLEEHNDDTILVEKPFIQVLNNEDSSFSVDVSFMGNQCTFTLRKDLSDSQWWILENGTVNGTAYTATQRFTLNSFLHFHKDFTYMIVSPYSMDNMLMCIAHSSLLIKA